MTMTSSEATCGSYQNIWTSEPLAMSLDISRTWFLAPSLHNGAAYAARLRIENSKTARCQPDEGRMVSHYWLRAPR